VSRCELELGYLAKNLRLLVVLGVTGCSLDSLSSK
jgi:hypothetical protein